ncbi:MAG: DUF3502 domain-containing protein, partial [Clostridiales bacterium]|nr:DUF3502 domain-containing protein [Clostridiales bacterium]
PGALLGFTLDAEPIKTELAAIATVLAKYLTQLNAGIVDVDVELPKLLNALKDAGSEKIVAEKQRQVDAWLVAMKK